MYMGETGQNTDKWQSDLVKVMKETNIGYTFWPYKKMGKTTFSSIIPPENWDEVVNFAESPRGSYEEIRKARPDMDSAGRP